MARIVLTTFGSAGDLNPFVALALRLREHGHSVSFAVERNFQPTVEALGFDVTPLTGDSATALRPYEQRIFASSNALSSLRLLMSAYVLPTLPAKIRELRAACEGADLLVAAASQLAASAVAELTDIPWASVMITPSTLPSTFIAPLESAVALPAALQLMSNRVGWALGAVALRRIVDRPVNAIRASFGLAPRQNILWTGNLSPTCAALAASPAFLAPPPDWPQQLRMTGFCFWDADSAWAPSPDLAAFLAAAQTDQQPLVAVTAGSVSPGIETAFLPFYAASLAAIWRCGARTLLLGVSPTIAAQLAERVQAQDAAHGEMLAIPFAPYSQIFPQCAAIIHHGGIGTVAQCLRAGVPSLIVPGGLDQPFNAAQVSRIGAGRWATRRAFTAERGASELHALLTEPQYRARAQAMQAQLAREDGAGTLCALIEGALK